MVVQFLVWKLVKHVEVAKSNSLHAIGPVEKLTVSVLEADEKCGTVVDDIKERPVDLYSLVNNLLFLLTETPEVSDEGMINRYKDILGADLV